MPLVSGLPWLSKTEQRDFAAFRRWIIRSAGRARRAQRPADSFEIAAIVF